jgi:hypothetical protein
MRSKFLNCAESMLWFLVVMVCPGFTRAENPSAAPHVVDPASVQRYGPAYRFSQSGWIVLHIEGDPYERGYQHGRLLATEIAAFIRCAAARSSAAAPSEGWRNFRMLANALFLRRFDAEYLEEMKGTADGAAAGGARFDGRAIDLIDILGLNVSLEVESLEAALEVAPTGLEGKQFHDPQPQPRSSPRPMHCSAFVATGPATADGRIVFGHVNMFELYPTSFFNVWLDVRPAKGHRICMQTFPAGIWSGTDYYLNDAGLLLSETTISQTRFETTGISLASRVRRAIQYSDTIDHVVETLRTGNNGLYANEWLLADIKTNEIAMLDLGTAASRLYRSSKNEWIGGTAGFYWGCNNAKDQDVRLESIGDVRERPENAVFGPSDRDRVWLNLYHKHNGKIDEAFAREALGTPPLVGYTAGDARFTTADRAKRLETWGFFGPPLGRAWLPTSAEQKRYPEIRALVSNSWTLLGSQSPAVADSKLPVARDLGDTPGLSEPPSNTTPTKPAWHGTLLPRNDADAWLAIGSACYERIFARELALRAAQRTEELNLAARDRIAVELFFYRSVYELGARSGGDLPLSASRKDVGDADWYRRATGKGVLILHELRQLLGHQAFQDVMESFGRKYAGKEVTSMDFRSHIENVTGKSLGKFFDYWLGQPGLPRYRLGRVTVNPVGSMYRIEGELLRNGPTPPATVELVVETETDEKSIRVQLDGERTEFVAETACPPVRLVVDKYGASAKANGDNFSIHTFYSEPERTLIVYGTLEEVNANREAAETLQRTIRARGSNHTIPIRSDTEVTEDEARSHHLLLIGRPAINRLVGRFRSRLPVAFGHSSFSVRGAAYAHSRSAVIMTVDNPMNPRYSLVVLAGLSADSTWIVPESLFGNGQRPAQVVILASGAKPRSFIAPASDLALELRK